MAEGSAIVVIRLLVEAKTEECSALLREMRAVEKAHPKWEQYCHQADECHKRTGGELDQETLVGIFACEIMPGLQAKAQ
ncbi:MAG: hypothetical protein LBG70_03600 [Bifidobacteriaceae bacterium]|jgi:hypothetical protein|nr:hypothetical protein [Bifidobacteriaceae bacterium]